MKKTLLLLVYVMAMLSFAACKEADEDASILLSEEKVSNPENVTFRYYSPDPCCIKPCYLVAANRQASELIVKCTNADAISIEGNSGRLFEEYTSFRGQWKAVLVNSNTIVITFDEYKDDYEVGYYTRSDGFSVITQTKKGPAKTYLSISRLINTSDPLNQ